MNIAVASGKGGTGKTTIATNLAYMLATENKKVSYVDCDVEEPNGHLFINPRMDETKAVRIPVPVVNEERCTGCGLCAKICAYSAIICLAKKVMTFHELCHGCGGCYHVCPEKAITEKGNEIGVIEQGSRDGLRFIHGRLHIGKALSPPLIRDVLRYEDDSAVRIIDAPPGTSCPVITAIEDADFVLLVTEPTPFGLHDLGLAIDMVRELKIPMAVVVNRHNENNFSARDFCRKRDVPIVGEIPDRRTIAEAYAMGILATVKFDDIRDIFNQIWLDIESRITKTGVVE